MKLGSSTIAATLGALALLPRHGQSCTAGVARERAKARSQRRWIQPVAATDADEEVAAAEGQWVLLGQRP